MTPEPTPLVTVTQADREAAAKALCAVHGLAMDIGPIGYAGIVRALVRHAANARLAALEAAAKVADEAERMNRWAAQDALDAGDEAAAAKHTYAANEAANLATAIRALSNKGGRDGE